MRYGGYDVRVDEQGEGVGIVRIVKVIGREGMYDTYEEALYAAELMEWGFEEHYVHGGLTVDRAVRTLWVPRKSLRGMEFARKRRENVVVRRAKAYVKEVEALWSARGAAGGTSGPHATVISLTDSACYRGKL